MAICVFELGFSKFHLSWLISLSEHSDILMCTAAGCGVPSRPGHRRLLLSSQSFGPPMFTKGYVTGFASPVCGGYTGTMGVFCSYDGTAGGTGITVLWYADRHHRRRRCGPSRRRPGKYRMGYGRHARRLCRHRRHPQWCRTGSRRHVRGQRCERRRLWLLGMVLNRMLVNMVMEVKHESRLCEVVCDMVLHRGVSHWGME